MKVYVSVPMIVDNVEWLKKHAPEARLCFETDEEFIPIDDSISRFSRTRFYYELPDEIGTLYLLRWS